MSQGAGRTTALLVIDMQNDFCLPGAVLCVGGAMGCVPKVIQAVATARARGYEVVWVVREHDASGTDVELFREPMFRQGKSSTVRGTEGCALVSGLSILPGEHSIVKKRFSAFFGTHLDMLLRRLGVTQVVLAGVQTPNCIRGSAWDALSLDYRVTVLSDATASATPEVQEANLRDMRAVQIGTPTVAEWAQSCEGSRGCEGSCG